MRDVLWAPAEFERLIQAAACGPIILKTSGQDRAALYLVALGTGFRANELRSLTPGAFDLDGSPPTVTVAAAYSKRRCDSVQPISLDLAIGLRPWLAAKTSGTPVFGKLTKHTATLVRRDLEAAGIPYRDVSGRVADFHALRDSYITALAMGNTPVKVLQTLARHSTPMLTLGTYAHVGQTDQTTALNALPTLMCSATVPEAGSPAEPGEDGPIRESFSLHLPYSGDARGPVMAGAGGSDTSQEGTEPENSPSHNSLILEWH